MSSCFHMFDASFNHRVCPHQACFLWLKVFVTQKCLMFMSSRIRVDSFILVYGWPVKPWIVNLVWAANWHCFYVGFRLQSDCGLVRQVLSATDPVAVVALFSTLGVSPKLTMFLGRITQGAQTRGSMLWYIIGYPVWGSIYRVDWCRLYVSSTWNWEGSMGWQVLDSVTGVVKEFLGTHGARWNLVDPTHFLSNLVHY